MKKKTVIIVGSTMIALTLVGLTVGYLYFRKLNSEIGIDHPFSGNLEEELNK